MALITYRRLVMPLTWWRFWRYFRADGNSIRYSCLQAVRLTRFVSR